MNEFADLTTSEFVSDYPEENPNIVWSGRKRLETHEYFNELLDEVKPDSCFQSSDEGPSFLFFVCRLESELNCQYSCVFCALVTSSLDQDSGPWVVSKISHFGITVSCSWSSCVHWSVRLNRTYFLVTDIIWVFIWIFYHCLAEPNYFNEV